MAKRTKDETEAAYREHMRKQLGEAAQVDGPPLFAIPTNESLDDIAVQIKIFEAIGKGWGVRFVRVGMWWAMYADGGHVLGFALAVKDTAIYRFHVYNVALQSAQTAGVPLYLFLATPDGVMWHEADPKENPAWRILVATVDEDRGPEVVWEVPVKQFAPARDGLPHRVKGSLEWLKRKDQGNETTTIDDTPPADGSE